MPDVGEWVAMEAALVSLLLTLDAEVLLCLGWQSEGDVTKALRQPRVKHFVEFMQGFGDLFDVSRHANNNYTNMMLHRSAAMQSSIAELLRF